MSDGKPLMGLRALIIEDEFLVAEDLKHLLHRHGASSVQLSGDIEDALNQIRTATYGLALLDIDMRGEMSFPVADELRRRRIPFAFMSGYDAEKIPRRFAAVPNWGKPYDGKALVTDIQRLWIH